MNATGTFTSTYVVKNHKRSDKNQIIEAMENIVIGIKYNINTLIILFIYYCFCLKK